MTAINHKDSSNQLTPHLYALKGAVNTGVLISGSKALLFDCCDSITPERLRNVGVESVEMICCTQHRRPNAAGAYSYVRQGAQLLVPASERHLFEDVATYWNDPLNRWHLYHHQPGPQVLANPLKVSRGVVGGDTIEWQGYRIKVIDTPGATDGSVSYLVEVDGKPICFSGDVLYGAGKIHDVSSLQKGIRGCKDYHGFMGNRIKLFPSLKALGESGAEWLVPSRGDPIPDPAAAVALVADRLDGFVRNYASISGLNRYRPEQFAEIEDDPQRMKPAQDHEYPAFVRRVSYTSFALVSDTGSALVIDCGVKKVIETLQEWLQNGTIKKIDLCWVTHYHDDHVEHLKDFHDTFDCPLVTEQHVVDVVEHPIRYYLPCISPKAAPIARVVKEGESWTWHEYKLTAYHFPGQTWYHSGLLVEGHGKKVFFAGDSGSPKGLDDHCCPNRNFLRKGKGFRRCIEIWRKHMPDYIFNCHQGRAFSYTEQELDYMDAQLAERERLLGDLLPCEKINDGLDENWVRAYPYEQATEAGQTITIALHLTNHDPEPMEASVEPVLPEGWEWDRASSCFTVSVPGLTDGSAESFCTNPDGSAQVSVTIPKEALSGRYTIPFRVTWGEQYLGQYRHAIVEVV